MFNVMLIKAQNPKHFEMNDINLQSHGGLAELVDCTGLENRRAARYRGFESLSLRFNKNVRIVRTFFICHTLRMIPQSCCFRNRSLHANLNT